MFQLKSNSEKFFKCFQHISMKHRPSWNHLDLKQMHWLFSQHAFFFKLQQADWQLLFGKVFSPLPWSTVACDTINTRARRQRKLRKDYEDEVSDRITLQDLYSLSLSHLESHLSDKDEKSSDHKNQERWRIGCVVCMQTAPSNVF